MQRDETEQALHWIDEETVARIQGPLQRPVPTFKQRVVAALSVAASGDRASGRAQRQLMYPIRTMCSERMLQDRAEIVLQIVAGALLDLLPPEDAARISQCVEAALETHPVRFVPRGDSPLSPDRSGPQAPQGLGL